MQSRQFWPLTQKRVRFDANTKAKWLSAIKQKPRQFRLLTPKLSQSILTLKNESFSARTQNQVNLDPNAKKQVDFDSDAKTKSISIPHIKTTLGLTPSLKSSQFWSPL